MKRTNVLLGFLILFVFIDIYIMFQYADTKRNMISDINMLRDNNKTLRMSINRVLSAKVKYDNLAVNTDTLSNEVYYDKLRNDLTSKFGEILLVIPEKSCNVCYDEVYDMIQYSKDSLGISISVMVSVNKYREVKNIFTDLQINTDIYHFKDKSFNNIKIESAPFFLYIDKEGIIRQIFIPLTTHTALTKIYLQKIYERYFKM